MLQQAVADLVVVGELGDVVDDAVLGDALDLLDRQHQALGHGLGPVVHPVAPVGVDAVAGADRDEVGQDGPARDLDPRLGEAHDRAVDDAGARDQVVLVLGAAQVLDALRRVGPHPLGLDERTLAVVALVADVHDRVVVELHREVVPHPAEHELALADAVASRARRPGAPPTSGRGCPSSGRASRRGRCRRPTASRTRMPVWASRCVSKTTLPLERRYWRGSSTAGMWPSQVTSMATRSSVGSTITRSLRSGSSTSMRKGPTEMSPRSRSGRRGAHDVLGVPEPHVDERVDDAEVRVLAHPEDGEPVVVARVHVEVVAVVEVAITGGRVRDELGRLVDRVVVHRAE